jgi:hypothetical protein
LRDADCVGSGTIPTKAKEHDMTRNTAPRSLRGLRSKRAVKQHQVTPVQPFSVPASRAAHDDEAHIWAVNAAIENGQTELAYELADRFLSA